ncbi:bifunctional adenosylcobinamide kinase/adenosylcobinamide-phosphate guanylyltransferase [Janibacter sp. GXQ6167]|uniref:bifunctional adenosylcobinamide kinase/adenosylcobinamide-phosphate guanylyltransferase n=1 Tax=Janibacter sp. GXQ6167 TaxID=3240791 RepID=UPI0035267FA5
MKTLITGGIRSGKSDYAESLFADLDSVTYIATGAVPEASDADWSARIAAHRAGRPTAWTTIETTDLPTALNEATGPVLIDSLGTWLTARLDALAAWDAPEEKWGLELRTEVTELVAALRSGVDIALVSEEVGMSVVSSNRAGRVFADWLGRINQEVATVCDRVVLVVAGQPLVVKG